MHYREIWTALRTNQIAEFITLPSWEKIKYGSHENLNQIAVLEYIQCNASTRIWRQKIYVRSESLSGVWYLLQQEKISHNRPFSKMAAEISNTGKSKLKMFTSSNKKNTFTLVTLQSFSISCVISAEKM